MTKCSSFENDIVSVMRIFHETTPVGVVNENNFLQQFTIFISFLYLSKTRCCGNVQCSCKLDLWHMPCSGESWSRQVKILYRYYSPIQSSWNPIEIVRMCLYIVVFLVKVSLIYIRYLWERQMYNLIRQWTFNLSF